MLVNLGKKITDYGGDKEIQNMGTGTAVVVGLRLRGRGWQEVGLLLPNSALLQGSACTQRSPPQKPPRPPRLGFSSPETTFFSSFGCAGARAGGSVNPARGARIFG